MLLTFFPRQSILIIKIIKKDKPLTCDDILSTLTISNKVHVIAVERYYAVLFIPHKNKLVCNLHGGCLEDTFLGLNAAKLGRMTLFSMA
jgi:hypothetical protein